jgi:uncharacterized protein (DUF1778 family)
MTIATSPPETTITLKISQEHKNQLEQAAIKRCLTLNEYLQQLIIDAVTIEIPEAETMVLSNNDWEIFAATLENPPPPNETLKSAIAKHQEKYGKW